MALINVPLATQSLGQTNASIRANWNSIVASYEVDHIPFNSMSDTGFHKKVTFVEQTTLPIAVTDPSILMYNALDATTAQQELYLKRQADGVGLGLPITEKLLTDGGFGANGYTFFPSGILMTWGTLTSPGGLTNTVTRNFSKNYFNAGGGNPSYAVTFSARSGTSTYNARITTQSPTSITFGNAANAASATAVFSVDFLIIGRAA